MTLTFSASDFERSNQPVIGAINGVPVVIEHITYEYPTNTNEERWRIGGNNLPKHKLVIEISADTPIDIFSDSSTQVNTPAAIELEDKISIDRKLQLTL